MNVIFVSGFALGPFAVSVDGDGVVGASVIGEATAALAERSLSGSSATCGSPDSGDVSVDSDDISLVIVGLKDVLGQFRAPTGASADRCIRTGSGNALGMQRCDVPRR